MHQSQQLFWFRQDLRLADNPAFTAAMAAGPVMPVYILDETATPRTGRASNWWLHHSLAQLDGALRALGSRLILRRGEPGQIIPELMAALAAGGLYVNRCYEPHAIRRDMQIKKNLEAGGFSYHSFKANLWFEPWEITTLDKKPYGVFTPFWKNCRSQLQPDVPLAAPEKLAPVPQHIHSDHLDDWKLLPTHPDWAGGLRDTWQPGEAAAQQRLKSFLAHDLRGYADGRNRPDQQHVSRLSPHLHWGEISPRQIFYTAQMALARGDIGTHDVDKFLAEVGWREFSYSLLYYRPDLPTEPLQPRFQKFPWQKNEKYLQAWQRGQTGYPIVDAGMRELWHTGYMHNRVRMITASFLIKNLLQPWQDGAAWFWDTLCDADLASNSASWQWVAGCGADAAPYFRIFNPILQGEKFDPQGEYVRRWVPELADVPDKFIHAPWNLPAPTKNYPARLVDLGKSRDAALAALKTITEEAS